VIAGGESLVPGEFLDDVCVQGPRVSERDHQGRQDGALLAGAIGIVFIDVRKHLNSILVPKMVCQSHNVEVVTHDVALHDEECLDTKDLRRRRSHNRCSIANVNLTSFERSCPTHLTQPSLDTSKAAHDREWWLRGPHRRRPAIRRLDGFKDSFIAIDQVTENMVMVERIPVTRIEGRSRSPNENRVGYDLLQPSSGA
jgi:hypothetical protein